MKPYTIYAYIYSLNKGKLQSTEMDEITILEEKEHSTKGKYYIADYKGVKCTAVFNGFNCCYYADDVYGVIREGCNG